MKLENIDRAIELQKRLTGLKTALGHLEKTWDTYPHLERVVFHNGTTSQSISLTDDLFDAQGFKEMISEDLQMSIRKTLTEIEKL